MLAGDPAYLTDFDATLGAVEGIVSPSSSMLMCWAMSVVDKRLVARGRILFTAKQMTFEARETDTACLSSLVALTRR